jgi:hypothetical protein
VTNESFFKAFLEKMAMFNSGGTPWKVIAMGALLFVWILSSLKVHHNQVSDCVLSQKHESLIKSSHL